MKVASTLIDHPRMVTGGIVCIVAIHAVAAKTTSVPTFAHALRKATGVEALYLGAAGAVAMIGGFAGIVVVFAMTQGLKRFAVMRVKGGKTLEANWIHPISITLASAFLLLAAAFCQLVDRATTGTWLFELALLLAVHGALRLVWLLSRLITAVRLQDADGLQPEATMQQAIPRMKEVS